MFKIDGVSLCEGRPSGHDEAFYSVAGPGRSLTVFWSRDQHRGCESGAASHIAFLDSNRRLMLGVEQLPRTLDLEFGQALDLYRLLRQLPSSPAWTRPTVSRPRGAGFLAKWPEALTLIGWPPSFPEPDSPDDLRVAADWLEEQGEADIDHVGWFRSVAEQIEHGSSALSQPPWVLADR